MKTAKNKIKNKLKRIIGHLQNWKKILRTPYWYLLLHEHLIQDIRKFKAPSLELLRHADGWKIFRIGGHDYFWPEEFSFDGLRSIYTEVFALSEINAHAYENKWIDIRKDDWIIDAGASEGFFIRYALSNQAKVLALEPIPRLADALRFTYEEEIKEGKVIILNMGLGEKTGISQLQLNHQQICSSIISEGVGENVGLISLDEILQKKIIPTVQFIKMDIEGGEISALLGAKKILKELKPKLSLAVYHAFDNALILRKFIRDTQPKYQIKFRGIFIRDEFGPPRPYMLHAR